MRQFGITHAFIFLFACFCASCLLVGCNNNDDGYVVIVDPSVFGRDSLINDTNTDAFITLYKKIIIRSADSLITEEISISAGESYKRDIFTMAPTPEIPDIEKGCDSVKIRFSGTNADTTLYRPILPRKKAKEKQFKDMPQGKAEITYITSWYYLSDFLKNGR